MMLALGLTLLPPLLIGYLIARSFLPAYEPAWAGAVLTTDPFVTTDPELLALDEVIARSDLHILCAPHAVYRDLDFAGKPVVDVWGFLKNANVIS